MAKNILSTLPSPSRYLAYLQIIISDSINNTDRKEAIEEREKMVERGLVEKKAIRPIFDKDQEGFEYIVVKGAKWS